MRCSSGVRRSSLGGAASSFAREFTARKIRRPDSGISSAAGVAGKRQIALLRGVNLGSFRKVSMSELRRVLTDLGYGEVRTLVNSGNVVLTSAADPARLQRELEQALAKNLGV